MSKINLSVNGNRAFGRYLPSIMINSISVDDRGAPADGTPFAEPGIMRAKDLVITANLTLNITKPKDMQDPAAWMAKYLGDLYLYAFMSGFERLNTELENKRLKLKDLISAYRAPNRSSFNSSSEGYDVIIAYLKEAFITQEWTDWSGDDMPSSPRAIYESATDSERAAGLEDPKCVFYYMFWGEEGETGPWWGTSPDGWTTYSDLKSSKTLYTDVSHLTQKNIKFEENNLKQSFVRKMLSNYLSFLVGASHSGMDDVLENNIVQRKIPLSDILTADNEYGANFLIQNVYDEEGNEIIQVSNINLRFEYFLKDIIESPDSGLVDYSPTEQRIKDTAKLFFISTIGIDTEVVGVPDTPRSLFNNYFGNISYEHVLENNEVPEQVLETWEIADTKAPYDDMPIANLDGRYHTSEPVGQVTVVDTIRSLIGIHAHRKDSAPRLKKNLDDLEALLEKHSEDIMILRVLHSYQRSYGPKDPSRPSGWFFNEFTTTLETLSKRVGYQPRLNKVRSRVGIVTDYRAMAINESYIAPNPYYKHGTSEPLFLTSESEEFIPGPWSRMSRNTLLASTEDDYGFTGLGSDKEQLRQDLWDDLLNSPAYDNWKRAGFTDDDMSAWVEATVAEMTIREGGMWTEADTEAAMTDDMHDPYEFASAREDDYIVQNAGFFWFDWEKALYTQSKVAQVIALNKLGRYFRMKVPYKYFQVRKVEMERREADLNLRSEGDLTVADWKTLPVHTIKFTIDFQEGEEAPGLLGQALEYSVSPVNSAADYAYGFPRRRVTSLREHNPGAGDASSIYSDDDANSSIGPGTYTEMRSYLKFCISDTAIGEAQVTADGTGTRDFYTLSQDTLAGYGYAPPGVSGSSTGYSVLPEDNAIIAGYKVRNGYRLMCFEYNDLMDDDVAFYNTMTTRYTTNGGGTQAQLRPNRQELLEFLNSKSQTNSEYKITIEVEDRTLQWYTEVFYPFISEAYDDFLEYYMYAEEFCSFNNLNGQFNTFFVENINKLYAGASEKRWVRAALVATLLKELFFKSSELESDSEESLRALIESEVLAVVSNISPEEGNLQALREFNCRWQRYLQMLNPAGSGEWMTEFCYGEYASPIFDRAVEVSGITPDEDGAATWDELGSFVADHTFMNYLQIDSPIYGDYMLSAETEDQISYGLRVGSEIYGAGIHPLSLPPMHVYITAGRQTNDYSDQRRILVRQQRTRFEYVGSPGASAYVEYGPWRFLESILIPRGEAASESSEVAEARTPILLDFGGAKDWVTGYGDYGDAESLGTAHIEGTDSFSAADWTRMFHAPLGAGDGSSDPDDWLYLPEHDCFEFVILHPPITDVLRSVPDLPVAPGGAPATSRFKISDPTGGPDIYITPDRDEFLKEQAAKIYLTNLFDGHEAGIGSEGAYVPTIITDAVETSPYTVEYPNWANFNAYGPELGAMWREIAVRDWRTYQPPGPDSLDLSGDAPDDVVDGDAMPDSADDEAEMESG